MSLITCYECETPMSEHADRCALCRAPIEAEPIPPKPLVSWPLVALVAVVVCLLAGCAARATPGFRLSPEFVEAWNCDPTEVMAEAERLREAGETFIPRVGWTSCELMTHNGRPNDFDLQQSASGASASWWYEVGADQKLVSLDLTPRGWVVRYVGW